MSVAKWWMNQCSSSSLHRLLSPLMLMYRKMSVVTAAVGLEQGAVGTVELASVRGSTSV